MKLLGDFTTSVEKAFDEIDPLWRSYEGLVVCGTHAPHDVDEILSNLQTSRENGVPTLGICFGLQMMAVEFARNVMNIPEATSEELSPEGYHAVSKLRNLNVGLGKDGESYWHNYAVVPHVLDLMHGASYKGYYKGVQFHPEYQSSASKPHPLLVEFLNICRDGNADGHPH